MKSENQNRAESDVPFTPEFLQAISDWQQGGDAREKHQRGQKLKRLAGGLDSKFRTTGLVCFRRVALHKTPIWKLLAEGRLDETISSWTATTDVAKTFKSGVPPPGWQGVILEWAPGKGPGKVIVNLAALYADEGFCRAIEKYKDKIVDYAKGMGKYSGTQNEVVIELDAVQLSDIYAMGGVSSEPHELGRVLFGREVKQREIAWMREVLKKQGQDFGPWWIDGKEKDRALQSTMRYVPELKRIKEAQKKARKMGKNRAGRHRTG